jgi:hypothetical protein
MSKKHHTKHRQRGRSTYSKKHKSKLADRYGEFKEGRQQSADRIFIADGEIPNRAYLKTAA